MGTWGSETFENDTAQDILGEFVDRLKEAAREDLNELDDGILERSTVPNVALLRYVAAGIPTAREMIDSEEVAGWRDSYMAWMDEIKSDFGADEDFFARFRANAAREFELLLAALVAEQ